MVLRAFVTRQRQCLPFEATSAAASRQTARRMHPLAAMLAVIPVRRRINTSPVFPD